MSGSADVGTLSVETKLRTLRTASAVASAPGLGSAREVAPRRRHVRARRGGAEVRLGVVSGEAKATTEVSQYEIRSGALTHVGKRHLARCARITTYPSIVTVIERCSISVWRIVTKF